MPKKIATDSPDRIAATILFVRGQRVMLDTDLANLYGVTTKVLLQAVRRNIQRFPEDFCFQLPADDWSNLRSQIVTSRSGYGGRRYTPYAFTEQGVAMLSSVLRSSRAIAVNIEIMRAFVRLREAVSANKELARQFKALEARIEGRLAGQDRAIVDILKIIRELMQPVAKPQRRIGFL
jgi:hypothetical protein